MRGIGRGRSLNNRRSSGSAQPRALPEGQGSVDVVRTHDLWATGYVGEHAARTAGRLGLKAIVAGRDASKLDRIASEAGLERRAFGLDDPTAIDRALKDVAVVLNCAGPFKYTAEPLVEGCLRSRAHYLDITGEIPVFEELQARPAGSNREQAGFSERQHHTLRYARRAPFLVPAGGAGQSRRPTKWSRRISPITLSGHPQMRHAPRARAREAGTSRSRPMIAAGWIGCTWGCRRTAIAATARRANPLLRSFQRSKAGAGKDPASGPNLRG